MADKNYKLRFTLSDGTEKSVQFTAPQGEKGEKGDKGDKGEPGSSYSKTQLWQWGGGVSFQIKTLTLPIAEYDAIEILYEMEAGRAHMASSGEVLVPTGSKISRCFLFDRSGGVNTTIDITSDGTFTFTFKDDEYGTPCKIYGIHR